MILLEKIPLRMMIRRGALFVVNHSGGKDSQCMYLRLRRLIPADQLVVIHATLGEVEWPGTIEHIRNTITHELFVCRNPNKTFLEMVERRGRFPDKSRRQCTSDLKRGPIETQVRRIMKARGLYLIVNCMGMRADESSDRARLQPFKYNERNSKAGREWYDWLPIHGMTRQQVFARIAREGQQPHWAYAAGMTRLSCSFCILASEGDLCTAARLRPELFQRYVALEQQLQHTLQMSGKPLLEIVRR